jgi:hypothetical protein
MATTDDLLKAFQQLPPLEQAKAAAAIQKTRPMATGDDLLKAFQQLPPLEQAKAAGAIQISRPLAEPLPEPPPRYVGILWLMVVGAFIILLLGGTILLYLLVQDGETTEVVAPLVTGALGVLAGLLAPSPIRDGTGG